MGMMYKKSVFDYVAKYNQNIETVAKQLNLSHEVIAGAIAEEYNAQSALKDGLGEWFASTNHNKLLENYNKISLPENAEMLIKPGISAKFVNPVLNDIGNGNIKIYTAIRLLNDYTLAHSADDPLDIKGYNEDYQKLVHDLNNDSNSATAIFAGLALKEAEVFFSTHAPLWYTYEQDYKDALMITYYNSYPGRIIGKYNEAVTKGEVYRPQPGGEESGGLVHLENLKELRKALPGNTTPTIYTVADQWSLEAIAASVGKTVSELEKLAGNEYVQDRKIKADNGGYMYLWKNGDGFHLTPTDHDADYRLPYGYTAKWSSEDGTFGYLEIVKNSSTVIVVFMKGGYNLH
jgi:hypothetical protein